MNNDDIEILDDVQGNAAPNSAPNNGFAGPQNNVPNANPYDNPAPNSGFHDMNYTPDPNSGFHDMNYDPAAAQNPSNPVNTPSEFYGDTNNNMVEATGGDQNLTITAVYPNGFAVEEKDELENTRVIKPAKKNSNVDLYLVIIVAVLAVTLIALLVVFYF